MPYPLPVINSKKEIERITYFLQSTLKRTGFNKVVIGVSGGIDSTTSLYLLRKVLPPKNIFIAHLHYFQSLDSARDKPQTYVIKKICSALQIPIQNLYILSIKKPVEEIKNLLQTYDHLESTWIRVGNIMARVRMITVFDLAKKHKALVCGTENKSEHYLGYFTRFGDAASDIEPIQHLYKTQVYQLAKYLKVPHEVIDAKPTAGLWSGQTDEGEFGFSYQVADQVLYLYHDRGLDIKKIKHMGFENAAKILDFVKKNSFKHKVPHTL